MAKFNITDKRSQTKASPGVIHTNPVSTVRTGNNAPGFAYEGKSALFLAAVSSMFGEKKFYGKAEAESARFVGLVKEVAPKDPAWMVDFITWLRQQGNMRTSAVVASVEASLATKGFKPDPNQTGISRRLAQAGIGRTDEIGEALAYWQATYPGKQIPKPIKRGLADACLKLINEYSASKYNAQGKAWTLGQALNVLHPAPETMVQKDLFGYLVAKEYGEVEIPESLDMLRFRKNLMDMSVTLRRALLSHENAAQTLKAAGMTWEALAGWLQGPMDAKAWEAIIPSMGYMALLRNLRNFDQAGISRAMADYVGQKLSEPGLVARSKQFPFRFLAAYRAAPSLRWGPVLSDALNASLGNIPTLPGRTLVMVDTSGSMASPFSEHSEMKMWDAAALFGIALAHRNPGRVDLVSYSNSGKVFEVRQGADVLGELKRWGDTGFNIGGGTNTFGVLNAAYRQHDRVIILTDEQTSWSFHSFDSIIPTDKHVFTFNLAGYQAGHAATGKFRHSFGGLTDACFPLIAQIEAGSAGTWPWENEQ